MIKVLSCSSVFPNESEPGLGLFIQARLLALAKVVELKIMAPVSGWAVHTLSGQNQGQTEVLHPRWAYIPGTGVITALFLFLQLLRPVRQLRQRFKFQMIDAHFGYPDGIAAYLLAATFKVPFIVTLRGSEIEHSRCLFRRLFLGWALRRASRVIGVSKQLCSLAIELGVDPAKTRTIANGIDASVFFPRDRKACRAKHNLPLEPHMILSAGYLIERKGYHHLIPALRQLVDEGTPVQLLIAGGPPNRGTPNYEGEIRRVIEELRMTRYVRLLGPINSETLAELMSAADVFCLASSREGWPNVVHEALSCGVPVVATKVGAVPELLGGTKCGLVVPPYSPAALAQALQRALQSNWNRDEISAWAHSRSWDQVAEEVHNEIVGVVREWSGSNKAQLCKQA